MLRGVAEPSCIGDDVEHDGVDVEEETSGRWESTIFSSSWTASMDSESANDRTSIPDASRTSSKAFASSKVASSWDIPLPSAFQIKIINFRFE
jgi:hypothetical protein